MMNMAVEQAQAMAGEQLVGSMWPRLYVSWFPPAA